MTTPSKKIIHYVPALILDSLRENPCNAFARNYLRQRLHTILSDELVSKGWDEVEAFLKDAALPSSVDQAHLQPSNSPSPAPAPAPTAARPPVENTVAFSVRFVDTERVKLYAERVCAYICIVRVPESVVGDIVRRNAWIREHRFDDTVTSTSTVEPEPSNIDDDSEVVIDTLDTEISEVQPV